MKGDYSFIFFLLDYKFKLQDDNYSAPFAKLQICASYIKIFFRSSDLLFLGYFASFGFFTTAYSRLRQDSCMKAEE